MTIEDINARTDVGERAKSVARMRTDDPSVPLHVMAESLGVSKSVVRRALLTCYHKRLLSSGVHGSLG
jgi:hypothetical protein